ncbi:MAG: preprotein translocase subunit SecE [Patescibacteria group bacterium]|nr:preprotein translocase subunit SecE [Patescibacteria group bacterium]
MFKKLIVFLKEARNELKKVKWPSKEQTMKYTKEVIIMSVAVAFFLGALDFIFNLIVTKIL